MIDNLSILISLSAIVLCVYRAVLLDALLPWFGIRKAPRPGVQARVPGQGERDPLDFPPGDGQGRRGR